MGGLFQHLVLTAALLASLFNISVTADFDVSAKTKKFQDEFDKLFHPHGMPDIAALQASQANVVKDDSVVYTSTGYVTKSTFMDSTCSEPIATMGMQVNVCLLGSSYAYMFRLVQDNCVGGVVEYYHDQACTKLAASVPLTQSITTECLEYNYGQYGNFACTSKSDPLVYVDSVMATTYLGENCPSNQFQVYIAFPANKCFEGSSFDVMLSCNGGLTVGQYKAGSGCTKQIDSTPIPDSCNTQGDDDDVWDDDDWDDDWDDDDWDDDDWDDDYWDDDDDWDDDGDDDLWDDDFWNDDDWDDDNWDDDDVAGDDAVATDDTTPAGDDTTPAGDDTTPPAGDDTSPPPPSLQGPVGGPVGAPGGGEPGHVGGAPGHAVAKKAHHHAKKLHQRRHGKKQHKAKPLTAIAEHAKSKALRNRRYPTQKVRDMSPSAVNGLKFVMKMADLVSGHKVARLFKRASHDKRSKKHAAKRNQKDQAVSSTDVTTASDASVTESAVDKKDAHLRHRTGKAKKHSKKHSKKHAQKHSKKHSKKQGVSSSDAVDAKPAHLLPPTPRKIVHELAPQPLAAESVSAAHAAHPAAAPDVAGRKVRKLKRAHKKSHQKDGKNAGGVSTAEPVPQMVTTDDDVNYYDDDGDDRYYIYDDYVYIYPHDDDYNFFDDDANGDDDYDDDDAGDYDDDWWRSDDDWSADDDDDPYADDYPTYYGGIHPPPSVIGTPFPTTPAQRDPVYSGRTMCAYARSIKDVSFTATQTIAGISLDTYNSNVQVYSKTLKQSIAACVSGATEDSISNLAVTAGSSSSVTTVVTILVTKRILSTSSIVATYTVTVTGTTKSSAMLAGELDTAVMSGNFDTYLHTNAEANGATGFETATSTSIDVEYNNDDDSSSGGPALSVGAIVGITIGCVAFVVLVAVGLVFLFGKRGASPSLNAATRANPATEMHVNPMQPGTATSVPAVPVQMVPVGGAAVQSSVYNPKADSAPAVEVKAV